MAGALVTEGRFIRNFNYSNRLSGTADILAVLGELRFARIHSTKTAQSSTRSGDALPTWGSRPGTVWCDLP